MKYLDLYGVHVDVGSVHVKDDDRDAHDVHADVQYYWSGYRYHHDYVHGHQK